MWKWVDLYSTSCSSNLLLALLFTFCAILNIFKSYHHEQETIRYSWGIHCGAMLLVFQPPPKNTKELLRIKLKMKNVECTFNTWISLEKCRVQGFDPLKPTIFFVLHSSFIFSSLIDHCSLSHCNNNQQHRKHRTAQKIQTTGYRTTHRTVIQYNNIHYCWLQLYSNNVRPKPKPKPKRWWISNIQSKSKCRTSHWQQCRRWHPSSNGINGQSSWISRAWSNQGEWFLCCFWGSVTSCQETQCK